MEDKRNYLHFINRLDKLESLGFECLDGDHCVTHPGAPEVVFDFSATDSDFFMQVALSTVAQKMFDAGKNSVRRSLHDLLKVED